MKKTNPISSAQKDADDEEFKKCPDCGHKMMKGDFSSGGSAWACTNFPECGRIDHIYTRIEQVLLEALTQCPPRKPKKW